MIIYILKFYKRNISPHLELVFGKACRFSPTCSEYTIQAVEKYGTLRGLWLGIKRFSRCHPLGGSGYDPVPDLTR